MKPHPHASPPRDPPDSVPAGTSEDTAASTDPNPWAVSPSRHAERARLALHRGPLPSAVAGAWWPRSADLEREVVPLVAALADARVGRVQRILYDPSAWLPAPLHRLLSDGEIETKPSPIRGSRQVTVTFRGGDCVVLSVVPATTSGAPAERAMRRVTTTPAEHGPRPTRAPVGPAAIVVRARPWFGTGGPAAKPPARG